MLSAHAPFETYPSALKNEGEKLNLHVQVAGGVPAMCDGITQGEPGMELSLFSRDTIALSTAIGLSHNVFDSAICMGTCDKIVPGFNWCFKIWSLTCYFSSRRSYVNRYI